MSEEKLRAATIGLFMKALIAELIEPNKPMNKSAMAIMVRVGKYVNKHFKTQEDQKQLEWIANRSWDKACDSGEFKVLSVATLCMEMYDSSYRELIEKELKITAKLIQNFYNACRGESNLRVKIDSKAVTKHCLECINKAIYDDSRNRTC